MKKVSFILDKLLNKKRIVLLTAISSLMTACVAAPEKESVIRSGSINQTQTNNSTESMKQREEQRYARLLSELQRRNAAQDARQRIAKGEHFVLGYQSGRGGLKIPGLKPEQNRCQVQQLSGMGDMLYGDNHLRYRVALRHYANQFNQVMLPYCR